MMEARHTNLADALTRENPLILGHLDDELASGTQNCDKSLYIGSSEILSQYAAGLYYSFEDNELSPQVD